MYLVKRGCADGLVEIEDHVSLGKAYQVERDSARTWLAYNPRARVTFELEMVRDVETDSWLPLDVLAEVPRAAG